MNKPLRTRSVTRKSRESGFLLPIVGFLALVPPVISLFADDARIFGVPMIILYIFFVWLNPESVNEKRVEPVVEFHGQISRGHRL